MIFLYINPVDRGREKAGAPVRWRRPRRWSHDNTSNNTTIFRDTSSRAWSPGDDEEHGLLRWGGYPPTGSTVTRVGQRV